MHGKKSCCTRIRAAEKKELWGLTVTFHLVNFYDSCAGLAGVQLILPAGFTRPPPAENALAKL
jgi:hypothetical protein